ncbi:MAG: RagB/SusD family nutrient uptake outer membrane protein, partial [Bacteroidales bacterium]|nr:RagB/SusD family nutrient uptake outer membrane protein [Bacteroidales bacterium]
RPYYFTRKFQDNPGYPVIRMSEIYLIRAEAAARLGLNEEALSDLRTIQARAGATLSTEADDILEALFIERRKELCFEGHLLFDIARFQKNVVREEGCAAKLCNLSYPSNFYILPIPERNVELNSNLTQNEGY